MRNQTRILMFHRVIDDGDASHGLPSCYRMRGTALNLAEFENVIDRVGTFVSLDAVEAALARGDTPPPGAVVTFDDGYREHLPIARLLRQRGVPAVFYVATGIHADGGVAPVDAWYWLLDHAVERRALIPLPSGGEYEDRLDTLDGKARWVGGVPKLALLAATPAQQRGMIMALADSVGCSVPSDLAARLYMRHSDWGDLVRLGMRVGAHSVSHALLTRATTEAMQHEVRTSVEKVGELCRPVTFSYPNGDHNPQVKEVARAAGVSSAVTCEAGVVERGADLLRLPREFVRPQSFARAEMGQSL